MLAAVAGVWLAFHYGGLVFVPLPVLLLAFLWLVFRDPRRTIPAAPLGVMSPVDGRVTADDWERHILARTYAAGWIKRGPVGLIGTNKGCAHDTVEHMIEDFEASGSKWPELPEREEIDRLLGDRGIRVIGFDDWRRVDDHERALGESRGKVREKLTSIDEVLTVLDGEPSAASG